jgi:pimeloyl-ACP methyl ester carboxylesterase
MSVEYLSRPDGERIAYSRIAGREPGVLWLSGFRSDLTGNKARHLAAWARRTDRAFLAFDYFGHGASSGDFAAGTIGRWRGDGLAALDELAQGPQILVGSSMGGWIALLLALARRHRIEGLILIAPAHDFTQDLIAARATAEMRAAWALSGVWRRPSAYGEPDPITLRLIEEGRRHLLGAAPIAISCPVHILHGMADPDIPFARSIELAGRLESQDVLVELIKAGDHRLSTKSDLERLELAVERLTDSRSDKAKWQRGVSDVDASGGMRRFGGNVDDRRGPCRR